MSQSHKSALTREMKKTKPNDNLITEKLIALLKDGEFVRNLKNAAAPDEIVELFRSFGIAIAGENALLSFEYLHEPCELNIKDLEEITGGAPDSVAGIASAVRAVAIAAGIYFPGESSNHGIDCKKCDEIIHKIERELFN